MGEWLEGYNDGGSCEWMLGIKTMTIIIFDLMDRSTKSFYCMCVWEWILCVCVCVLVIVTVVVVGSCPKLSLKWTQRVGGSRIQPSNTPRHHVENVKLGIPVLCQCCTFCEYVIYCCVEFCVCNDLLLDVGQTVVERGGLSFKREN